MCILENKQHVCYKYKRNRTLTDSSTSIVFSIQSSDKKSNKKKTFPCLMVINKNKTKKVIEIIFVKDDVVVQLWIPVVHLLVKPKGMGQGYFNLFVQTMELEIRYFGKPLSFCFQSQISQHFNNQTWICSVVGNEYPCEAMLQVLA